MSKLVTSDNLKAYHSELAEHIKLLQRNTAYVLDDIVNYDGITLKCTTAGTTNTTKPNISLLSVGSTYTDGTCVWTRIDLDKRGIDYYVASKYYEVDDQVVYDNKIYKCITAHTSTATFDITKWTEISAGGGGIDLPEWQANTAYTAGKYLVYEGTVYKVTTSFTSSTEFDDTNLEVYIAPNYNIYLTTEQEIGTWIDSKKLYRRTFNNPTDGLSTGLTSSLVSIKRIYGHCIQENEWQFDIPFYEPNGGIALYIDVTTGILSIDSYGNYTSGCVFPHVIVEYTKN